ncbi:hypothetical protein FN846DRAFT_207415 [Sphaerosporella brunnea]|uniref:AMP-dependent synthetase/ligase domain-containing protein n=1 Tax=Sphaerosporella brunnea TaxID=1250544 RepID=A0A5J5ENB9_9PEZI|nr:hypothetical protein FN846DRAFT_207415 [Sphaerosporella brunnea]
MFTLDEILLRASTHPMYAHLLGDNHRNNEGESKIRLDDFPTVDKAHLISGFAKLLETDPTALHAAYLSPTGGTRWGSKQLYFVSDARENRLQRVEHAERVLRTLGVFTPTDIVVNLHGAGSMYRSLDLIGALIEYSGATDLSVGVVTTYDPVVLFTELFRANVVTGTASRVLEFAEYIAAHPEHFSKVATLTKVVYTSETMTRPQELFLRRVLKNVEWVASIYGSAEAGPWAATKPQRDVQPEIREWNEFVFDSELMVVEIMDPDGSTVLADSRAINTGGPDVEPEDSGSVGEIVLTSLSRARNPLVRYRTGDLGSLSRYVSPDAEGGSSSSLCCLRFRGRAPEKSFDLDGDYMDVAEFQQRVFSKTEYRVIEWQVIIDSFGEAGCKIRLEFRVVAEGGDEGRQEWEEKVQKDIVDNVVGPQIQVVVRKVDYTQLERGKVARKVVKVLDRRAGRIAGQ